MEKDLMLTKIDDAWCSFELDLIALRKRFLSLLEIMEHSDVLLPSEYGDMLSSYYDLVALRDRLMIVRIDWLKRNS